MTELHPDHLLMVAVANRHDQEDGNFPDTDDRIAGVDSFVLTGISGHRARRLLQSRQDPADRAELERLLAAFWRDGFAIGVRTQQAREGQQS